MIQWEWGKRTYLMGVLNITPDSFSDGGQYNTLDNALQRAQQMVEEGVDIIDIGGQSTRPGAITISLEEELARVIPIIQSIRHMSNIPISIDTTRAAVARAAVGVGADMINDISGATFDEQMLSTVAQLDVALILMHIKGTPATMQQLTDYGDVMGEIKEFLAQRVEKALDIGIKRSHLIIDPGIGFAKTPQQSLQILRELPQLRSLQLPLLVGPSRKSFIGYILQQHDPPQRVWGTAAACCAAIAGGADILRVHDVAAMRDVCKVADAIWR